MAMVVRFTLSTARDLDISGVGSFVDGVLDVDANDLQLLTRTRYLVQPYHAIEVGFVDSEDPPPALPAEPVPPPPDPYPQYMTPEEVKVAAVPFWSANETVTANTIRIDATGQIIKRNSSGTTRPTYDVTEQALWTIVSSGGGTPVVDATTTVKGIVELATNTEAAAGTDTTRVITPAALKSVTDALPPGYTDEQARDAAAAALTNGTGLSKVVDDPGDKVTLAVVYGTTAGTAVQGNDARVTADQAASTASIRTIGSGPQQAKPGDYVPPLADLPAGLVITMVQNGDGSWPNRRSSRTDLLGMWIKNVVGSADPTAATSPAVTGAYANDIVTGV